MEDLRRLTARASALLILLLGVLAITYPPGFASLLDAVQAPPALYVAAALRSVIGITFLAAARNSRGAFPLYFLGAVMLVGGLVIPIIGQGLARPILDAWVTGGSGIVRGWGVAAVALGSFALWALQPRAPTKTDDQH